MKFDWKIDRLLKKTSGDLPGLKKSAFTPCEKYLTLGKSKYPTR